MGHCIHFLLNFSGTIADLLVVLLYRVLVAGTVPADISLSDQLFCINAE